jgi:hypothetical protein
MEGGGRVVIGAETQLHSILGPQIRSFAKTGSGQISGKNKTIVIVFCRELWRRQVTALLVLLAQQRSSDDDTVLASTVGDGCGGGDGGGGGGGGGGGDGGDGGGPEGYGYDRAVGWLWECLCAADPSERTDRAVAALLLDALADAVAVALALPPSSSSQPLSEASVAVAAAAVAEETDGVGIQLAASILTDLCQSCSQATVGDDLRDDASSPVGCGGDSWTLATRVRFVLEIVALPIGAKNSLFQPLYAKNYHCVKTGSGQT